MGLKRLNQKMMGLSLLICILITLLIPSKFLSDGMGRYEYGFPFNNITIYQVEPVSKWFGTNFFFGHGGLFFDPFGLVLNVATYYILMMFILKKKTV